MLLRNVANSQRPAPCYFLNYMKASGRARNHTPAYAPSYNVAHGWDDQSASFVQCVVRAAVLYLWAIWTKYFNELSAKFYADYS